MQKAEADPGGYNDEGCLFDDGCQHLSCAEKGFLARADANLPERCRGAIMGTPCSSTRETLSWGPRSMGRCRHLEVALRNTMHTRLEERYGSQWYTNPAAGLDSHAHDSMADVLRRGAGVMTADRFVASMSLGFWVRLVGRGGRINDGRKAEYDRTLWRPALHRAFPGHSRRKVQRRLDSLRQLRNRIAHHEPIVGRDLNKDHDNLLEALEWISSDVRAWIECHSNLRDVLQTPLSAPIRF